MIESKREVLDQIADELEEDILVADGFDDAIIGISEVWDAKGGKHWRTVYHREACIGILMERDGMTFDEATEYFEYNVAGSYVGVNTPLFVTMIECNACALGCDCEREKTEEQADRSKLH